MPDREIGEAEAAMRAVPVTAQSTFDDGFYLLPAFRAAEVAERLVAAAREEERTRIKAIIVELSPLEPTDGVDGSPYFSGARDTCDAISAAIEALP